MFVNKINHNNENFSCIRGYYLRQNGLGSQQTRTGLKCATGSCITNYYYQPNGNQMCMLNFESEAVARDTCDKLQCDLIVKYTAYRFINGNNHQKGIFLLFVAL